MARNSVKYYKFCMGKFTWTRNLMVRSDFKNYNFVNSYSLVNRSDSFFTNNLKNVFKNHLITPPIISNS